MRRSRSGVREATGSPRSRTPVGVDYPLSNLKRGASPYRSPALLPPQIRLPDGKVSCVSCHDLYSAERDRLTVRIEGSALCLTCHQMD